MKKETKKAIELALGRAESAFVNGARFGTLTPDTDWEGMLRDVKEAQRLLATEPVLLPEVAADGILRLIREMDEAKQKAADWEQTARELMKAKVKP